MMVEDMYNSSEAESVCLEKIKSGKFIDYD